jgi:hypothetical protein
MARRKLVTDISGKSCNECAVPDKVCDMFNDCPIRAAKAVAPYIKESRPTVRRKPPAQQPQAKMPPCKIHKKCEFYLKMYCGENTERFACYQPPAARSAMR